LQKEKLPGIFERSGSRGFNYEEIRSTGLGLSIVKDLCCCKKGEITVESDLAKHNFQFQFPYEITASQLAVPPLPETSGFDLSVPVHYIFL